MGIFADPRAFGLTPANEDESQEMRLLDSDLRVLATAIRYGNAKGDEWWGICSHRSVVPIDRRATSFYLAKKIMMTTVWTFKLGTERDEFEHFDGFSRRGVLYIRSLTDEQVLEAARSKKSATWKQIFEWAHVRSSRSWIDKWITDRCAEVAYMRGVMDAREKDRICR